MSDTAQLNLTEPTQTNWDAKVEGSKYSAPPPAKDAAGKYITYFAQLPQSIGNPDTFEVTADNYRRFQLGPLTLVKSGSHDGYVIKYYSTTLRPMVDRKTGKPRDINSTALMLKAANVAARPQKTADYENTIKLARGKIIPITIEWMAKNRDTGEEVDGFDLFPLDPDRPGQRKAILKAGDVLTNMNVVTSEILFANGRVRFISDNKK